MLIDIDKVIVPERARKTFSNIDKLAKSIEQIGLIHPPTVTPEYELIAGERRLRALRSLGYKQIEVRVMSVEDGVHHLKMERDENDNRESFTFSEAVALGLKIEEEEKKKARERMSDGGKGKENFPTLQTRDAVAEAIGIGSGKQYEKAKYIHNNADEETIKKLNEEKISIHKAWTETKKRLEEEESRRRATENELSKQKKAIKELEEERNKKQQVEIKTIEREVDKTDYQIVKRLEEENERNQKKLERLERDKALLEKRLTQEEADANEHRKLKEELKTMSNQKESIHRQVVAATSLSKAYVEIENLLKKELAPIRYSRAITEAQDSEVAMSNLSNIIGLVEEWARDMRSFLPNSNKNNTNIVEVIDYE